MFSGVNAVVCGILQAERASKLRDIIVANGGTAVVHKAVASIFTPKATEFNDAITHVISGASTDSSALLKKLNVSSIPPAVKVVKDKWILDCIEKATLQPEVQYTAYRTVPDIVSSALPAAPNATQTEASKKRPLEPNADCQGRPTAKKIKNDIPHGVPGSWEELRSDSSTNVQALYKVCGGTKPFTEMIAFDLDGTLIQTKSGKRFAQNTKDWKFFCPSIPEKLKELSASGKYLAIISNQNGVGRANGPTLTDIKEKLDDILSRIDCPIDVFCAFKKDLYRKPRIGSYELLKSQRVQCPEQLRFTYVGDAAGRPQNGSRSKDFAATDLAFALNCKAEFQTPEQLFLQSKLPLHCNLHVDSIGFSWPQFAEMQLKRIGDSESAPVVAPPSPELIVLVGPPSSGKSTRSRTDYSFAEHINQDILKTVSKCLAAAKVALKSGQSVVVDSTNVDKKTRQQWIKLAQDCNITTVRCVACVPPKAACIHLSKFRYLDSATPPADRREIADVVFHTYYKNYVPPSVSEGFTEVIEREFVPFVPKNSDSFRLLNSYL